MTGTVQFYISKPAAAAVKLEELRTRVAPVVSSRHGSSLPRSARRARSASRARRRSLRFSLRTYVLR